MRRLSEDKRWWQKWIVFASANITYICIDTGCPLGDFRLWKVVIKVLYRLISAIRSMELRGSPPAPLLTSGWGRSWTCCAHSPGFSTVRGGLTLAEVKVSDPNINITVIIDHIEVMGGFWSGQPCFTFDETKPASKIVSTLFLLSGAQPISGFLLLILCHWVMRIWRPQSQSFPPT